jgi:rSAM/selenodomain-associated transferase 1
LDAFRKGSGSSSSSSSGGKEKKVVDCRVRYDDSLAGEDGESKMKAWLGLDWIYEPQGPGDLGERMAAATALADGGEKGVGSVVLIGSDCPFIKPKHLKEALAALEEEEGGEEGGNDLVLGPAKDGGYWLIGLRRPCPELFQGVDWGTGRVLEQTLAIAAGLGMKVKLLEALHDMDRPEDLKLWSPPPLTSIIIPTLNEASNLAATLAAVYNGTSRHHAAAVALLEAAAAAAAPPVEGREGGWKAWKNDSSSISSSSSSSSSITATNTSSSSSSSSPPQSLPPPFLPSNPPKQHKPHIPPKKNGLKIHDPNLEVIVVDGGSTDGTQRLALALGARLVHSPLANRAAQMNLGAAAAAGDLLLFLHGDTLLPPTWEDDVRGAFARDPSVLATAFKLQILGKSPLFRVIEASITARSSWPWSLPYGDQALAVKRKVFDVLGGFPDVPIMEDYSFVQALQVLAKRPPPPRPRSRRKGGREGGEGGREGGMYGGRIELLPSCVRTSGRRWERLGVVKTTMINQCVILGWHLKVEPDRLALFYRQAKQGGRRERGRWWERKGEPMMFFRARGGEEEGEEEEGEGEEEEEEEEGGEERRRTEEEAYSAVLPLVAGF